MPIPSARIDNPSARESLRLRCWRLAQAFANLPPVFYLLSWLFTAMGAAMVLSPSYAFLLRGDVVGVIVFGLPALLSLYELLRLPMSRDVWLPAKFFWSLVIGVPIVGVLFFRISYRAPKRHGERDGRSDTSYLNIP